MIFIKFKPSWPCSVRELSDFVSPTAHKISKYEIWQNNTEFILFGDLPLPSPSQTFSLSVLFAVIKAQSHNQLRVPERWLNEQSRNQNFAFPTLCGGMRGVPLPVCCGDRPGPAGPSLTLGQSNRAPVPTASTYVNFLEGILGDFRIWEIYGDFWIVGTLGILPPPQSVQLCCGPNGIIPHWHFWGDLVFRDFI